MHVLTDANRVDIAYDIVTNKNYPGWGHWIELGADTLWEHWSGKSSLNHHMFSDVSAFFYRGLAGIRNDYNNPGFKNVILKPCPVGDLKYVNAWHDGPYGRIISNWTMQDDKFEYLCNIPPGSTGTLVFPDKFQSVITLKNDDGENVDKNALKLDSGSYKFVCEI